MRGIYMKTSSWKDSICLRIPIHLREEIRIIAATRQMDLNEAVVQALLNYRAQNYQILNKEKLSRCQLDQEVSQKSQQSFLEKQ
jgi:hypothetical protein